MMILPLQVSGQPNSPWVSFGAGLFLVALGAAWLWFGDFIRESGKSVYESVGLGWMWNDRVMKLSQKASGVAFIVVGALVILTSGVSE